MADDANAVRRMTRHVAQSVGAANPAHIWTRTAEGADKLAADLTELAHAAGDAQRKAERDGRQAEAQKQEGRSTAFLEAANLAGVLARSLRA